MVHSIENEKQRKSRADDGVISSRKSLTTSIECTLNHLATSLLSEEHSCRE